MPNTTAVRTAQVGAAPFFAGKNKIINGDFGIWQRGTSFTATGYTADRWYFSEGNVSTLSQQTFTAGAAPVAGYESQYFLRIARTSGSSDDYLIQRIEDVRTLAGQTFTLSFWAKADAAATIAEVYLEQNFGSGGSASTGTGNFSGITLTTSWARYTVTATLPSISGKTLGAGNFLGVTYKLSSTLGNRTIDFWGVQLEAGSVATPFQTATGTIQGELAACRRYLPAIITNTGNGCTFMGYAYTTNAGIYAIPFDTVARVAPTGITVPAMSNFTAYNKSNGSSTPTYVSFDAGAPNGCTVLVGTTLTTGDVSRLNVGATGGYILFTGCEL